MNILMTGGTGFIGKELAKKLVNEGHKLTVVTRNEKSAKDKLPASVKFIECDLNTTALSAESFFEIDSIINLAGEPIDSRWTKQHKQNIKTSRIAGTKNLLLNCPASVKTLISTSAIGFYGDRGNEELTESSPKGSGFLSDVCKEWELEAQSFSGERLVILRFGMVLSPNGGALKTLIKIFSSHVGSPVGSGQQWVSFISLTDLHEVILKALKDEQIRGIYNAVNNHPVTNENFSKALAKKLDVILLPRVPSMAIKLVMGEMSELILYSQKVKTNFPYNFKDTTLESVF
ncbi:MAG: cell division inhibitor [Pseudobdellovibrio sp.]|jgi:uncharacterized protein (TIGR01777 family)|nr:cell division inhibitor [Pseudobdellovibrio sp.]